jgi:hypothetical protein
VPLNVAACGLLLALSTTVSDPEAAPVVLGLNVAVIVQEALEPSDVGQLLVSENGPVTVMLLTAKDCPELLVKLKACGMLILPAATLPKLTSAGESVAVPGELPVPLPLPPIPLPAHDNSRHEKSKPSARTQKSKALEMLTGLKVLWARCGAGPQVTCSHRFAGLCLHFRVKRLARHGKNSLPSKGSIEFPQTRFPASPLRKLFDEYCDITGGKSRTYPLLQSEFLLRTKPVRNRSWIKSDTSSHAERRNFASRSLLKDRHSRDGEQLG